MPVVNFVKNIKFVKTGVFVIFYVILQSKLF